MTHNCLKDLLFRVKKNHWNQIKPKIKIHIERRKQEKNEGFEMSVSVFIQINMQWLHIMDL